MLNDCLLFRRRLRSDGFGRRFDTGVDQTVDNGKQHVVGERAFENLPCTYTLEMTAFRTRQGFGNGQARDELGAVTHLNKKALTGAELMPHATRAVNMSQLGHALNELSDPPVKALFVYSSNPAAVAPNHNAVVRGLLRPDLFTVVHEQFFTDTTDYADIILPATTFFEHKDLQTGYGHYYVQISNRAIEPLGECRSNVELFRALAVRMGFADACFRESVDQMIDLALSSPHPHLAGIDRARLEREHFVRLNLPQHNESVTESRNSLAHCGGGGSAFYLPFADGFPTRNGKALLYNADLAAQGLDPVVSFTPPRESRHSGNASYPLELLARKCDNYLNSTFANLPAQQKMEDPDLLEISVADAEGRGIADGDRVRVFNARGEVFLSAWVNGKTRAGVVAARLNWAKLTGQARNINVLTSERLTDMGGGATFYSVLVDVERAP